MGRPPLPIGTWGDVRVTKEGDVWRASARYRGEDGVTRPYSRRRPGKQAAKDALLEHFVELRDVAHGGQVTRDTTIDTLASVWIESWKAARDRKVGTIRAYRAQLEKIRSRIGEVRVGEITTGRLDAVVQGVRKDSGDETARQVRNLLRQMFAEAVRLDAIRTNPAADTRTVTTTQKQVRTLTGSEVARLRTKAREWENLPRKSTRPWDRPRIAASIDTMLGTGLRIGETLALRWEDIDLASDTPTLIVTGTIVKDEDGRPFRQDAGKSDSSERTLYLPAFTVAALTEHRVGVTEIPETGAVFPSAVGSWLDPDNYRSRFRDVRKLAKLDWVTPHTLRATVATQVYRAGSLATASQQLGHSEVGVTSRHYVERENRGPSEVVGLLDEFVS